MVKNKELLNICYKFFNRFITANELIEEIANMDKIDIDENSIDKLINEIKKIIINTPNEVDELIVKKRETIQNLINKLERVPEDDKNIEFLNREVDKLKKELNKEMDSYERWLKVTDCIDNNEYFNKCFESLSDYELLEFIAQYIQAPFPPQFKQDEFERLVKAGIEHDEREWLWRLAFNYENHDISFDSIVDYFIEVKDGYYISELISAVGKCLNIDDIIDKINDKQLIEDLKNRKEVISSYVSDEQFNHLINKLNN